MGRTTLHAGIVAQWFEILLFVTFLKMCYYGRQWDLIWCNDTSSLWPDAYRMYTVIGWQWLEAIVIGQWPTKRGFPHSPYLLRWRSA